MAIKAAPKKRDNEEETKRREEEREEAEQWINIEDNIERILISMPVTLKYIHTI